MGSFVVILGAATVIAMFWLGKTDYRGVNDRYEAYMRESVAGLSVDSTVKYRGVDVGRVKDIALSQSNPEEVLLTLESAERAAVGAAVAALVERLGSAVVRVDPA